MGLNAAWIPSVYTEHEVIIVPLKKKNLPATDNKLHTIPLHLEADKNWQHFYQKSFQKLFFL